MDQLECERRRGYRVQLRRGLFDPSQSQLATTIGDRRALFVTTPTVFRHYGAALSGYLAACGVEAPIEVLSLRERTKTMESVLDVCRLARLHKLGRRDVLVAFGGGVTTDVVSVAASLFRRGVPCLRLPTSLIGQVDAGIGVKSAVNADGVKSALGCFDPPEAVLSDPGWIATLPPRALRSGFAEVIKIALLCDPDLVDLLSGTIEPLVASGFTRPEAVIEPLLARAIELMLNELQSNPFEDNLERIVDFGHTFSPALETASDHVLTHGEAVAIDIAISTQIARRLGLLGDQAAATVMTLLELVGLPTTSALATPEFLARAADEAAANRGGAMNLILLRGLGIPAIVAERRVLSDALLRDVGEKNPPSQPSQLERTAAAPTG